MSENINLKSLYNKVKVRPMLKDVAKYANISQGQLTNIIAGRRKSKPEVKARIEKAFRRVLG